MKGIQIITGRCGLGGILSGRPSGFTLTELVIGLGLATLVLTAIVGVFTSLTRSYTTQNVAADVQQTTRIGIDYIAQEIRMAGLDPTGSAGAGIEEIAPAGNKIRFTADYCDQVGSDCELPAPDGDLDDNNDRVTYFYDQDQSTLWRCLNEPASTESPDSIDPSAYYCRRIIDNVVPNPDGTSLFEFFDVDDNRILTNADRGLIRTVVITLTVQEPAGRGAPVSRTYGARVRCRNIGL